MVGGSASTWRKIVIAQALFCIYTIGIFVHMDIGVWRAASGGAPRSPLFGIWEVDTMTVAGETRAPVLSDSSRWRRVIFQGPRVATFQRMDDSVRRFVATVDSAARSLTLVPADTTGSNTFPMPDSAGHESVLTYRRADHEHLLIDGQIGAQQVHLALTFRDPDSFLQRRRGFHWVSEAPFNR